MKNVIPFQKETIQKQTEHLFVFRPLVWIPRPNKSNWLQFCAKSPKTSKFEEVCFFDNFAIIWGTFLKNCKCLFKNVYWIPGPVFLELQNWSKGLQKSIQTFQIHQKLTFTYFKSFWLIFYIENWKLFLHILLAYLKKLQFSNTTKFW